MTTATSGPVARSGPAIRDALEEHVSSEEAGRFAAGLRDADRTLDSGQADAVLRRSRCSASSLH